MGHSGENGVTNQTDVEGKLRRAFLKWMHLGLVEGL